MKYVWYVFGFIFAGITVYCLLVRGNWESIYALWSLVAFLQGDVKDLENKIK